MFLAYIHFIPLLPRLLSTILTLVWIRKFITVTLFSAFRSILLTRYIPV